jgi:hypothetical protein
MKCSGSTRSHITIFVVVPDYAEREFTCVTHKWLERVASVMGRSLRVKQKSTTIHL